jgi:regulatory protein
MGRPGAGEEGAEPAGPDSAKELKARALRLLMRREHSRAELSKKLLPHAESGESVELLLEELVQKKFLSEDRMAEARAHVLSRKYGASRVRHDLAAKGVAEETIERVAAEARSTELERATTIFKRKFREPPGSPQDRAKRMRFLASRGFSGDTIRKVIAGSGKDDPGEESFN